MLGLLMAHSSWVLYSPIERTITSHRVYELRRTAPPGSPPIQATPWLGPQSFSLDIVAIRWGLSPQLGCSRSDQQAGTCTMGQYNDAGLASGISFALHRDFCSRLLPLFPEANGFGSIFLDCDDIRDTVKRAMDTWAINHKKISFIDVTDACRNVTSLDGCPHAELFIVADSAERSNSVSNDLAVSAGRARGLGAAHPPQLLPTHVLERAPRPLVCTQAEVRFNLARESIDWSPYATTGVQLAEGIGVQNARMIVRAPSSANTFCWYLDSTFCYQVRSALARRETSPRTARHEPPRRHVPPATHRAATHRPQRAPTARRSSSLGSRACVLPRRTACLVAVPSLAIQLDRRGAHRARGLCGHLRPLVPGRAVGSRLDGIRGLLRGPLARRAQVDRAAWL
jgi:hypothetical protein